MAEFQLITGMVLVTFLVRYPLLAVSGRVKLPPRLLQALNYVPPAVLTAIVVPIVLVEGDHLWLGLGNPRLVGAIATVGISLWKKNLLLTIVAGMGVFLLWKAMF
ncbi:MAG: AzlD domain-containing protein [Leptolyngbyaceae cyanobacterium]